MCQGMIAIVKADKYPIFVFKYPIGNKKIGITLKAPKRRWENVLQIHSLE